jgi:hypothetical protein
MTEAQNSNSSISDARFSTDYWHETRRAPSRLLPYGLALLLLAPVLPQVFGYHAFLIRDYQLVIFLCCNFGFLLLVPVLAGKRAWLPERVDRLRQQLLSLSPGRQRAAARKAHIVMLINVLKGPSIVLLAAFPALALALADHSHSYWEGGGVHPFVFLIALWAQIMTSMIWGASFGGFFPWFRPPKDRAMFGVGIFSGLMLRLVVVVLGSEAMRPNLMWDYLAIDWDLLLLPANAAKLILLVDTPLWLLLSVLVVLVGGQWHRVSLQAALPETLPEDRSDAELLNTGGEGLGLEVSFWSLLRWKYWLDPLYQAERRNLWSLKRRVLFLGGTIAVCAVFVFSCSQAMKRAGGQPTVLGSMEPLRYLWYVPFIPLLLAPLVMILGISRDKRTRCLESFRLTPAAPLRLAAAKLLGRLGTLAASLAAMCLVCAIISFLIEDAALESARARGMSYSRHYDLALITAEYRFWSIAGIVVLPAATLALGSIGLFFGARYRSAVFALVLALATSLLCASVLVLLDVIAAPLIRNYYFGDWPRALLWIALGLISSGVVLRVFLTETSRCFALRDV